MNARMDGVLDKVKLIYVNKQLYYMKGYIV